MGLLACLDAIKNTTGYAINALADFSPTDPIEILKRIMIGSEGTLGFVSQVTYQTVPDHPYKASAFLLFSDIEEACDATAALRKHTEVSARAPARHAHSQGTGRRIPSACARSPCDLAFRRSTPSRSLIGGRSRSRA